MSSSPHDAVERLKLLRSISRTPPPRDPSLEFFSLQTKKRPHTLPEKSHSRHISYPQQLLSKIGRLSSHWMVRTVGFINRKISKKKLTK
jgi:hypothetical protein